MEWAMTELLCNPIELLKVSSELWEVTSKGNLVEETNIPHLPCLQFIVKEAFRLHSPVPLVLPRLSGEDKEVGGYVMPKGALVLVDVGEMGEIRTCGERMWRSSCQFVGNDIDIKGQHFELVPFGGGRRMCPGLPLANRMLHAILASMLNNFDWKLEDWVANENLNMDEKIGIALRKVQPLRADRMIKKEHIA